MRASRRDPDRADEVADLLAAMSFQRPFRPYQERALDAIERQRVAGDRRFYLTMPPGSGKTLMGLEIARRLGRPTLVLGPNTAVQAQWLREWAGFEQPLVAAGVDPTLLTPITILTYQAIVVLDRSPDDLAASDLDGASEPPPPPRSTQQRRQERLLIARGGDHDAVLGLLHRNGRAIIERLRAKGPVTLVLDECHHLLNLWGHVLEAVITELHPESAVIGLTATPPREFVAREAALYQRLFGTHADFEVVTPAVVKDGYLAPYQELAYMTRPTLEEQRWIAREQERFDALLSDLFDPSFATTSFGAWFAVRFIDRRTGDGAPVGWRSVELDEPDLARAALRWVWSRDQRPPPGAAFREEHRREPDTADWIALLGGYVDDALRPSTEEYDRIALERIRKDLPSVGFVLTRRGIRRGRPVVDRVQALSAAKANATVRILKVEDEALGRRLRALVLCDFESAGRDVGAALRGVLAPGAGSAAAALRALLADEATARLDPVLVSGRTVACSRSTATALAGFARNHPDVHSAFEGVDPTTWGQSRDPGLGWGDVVVVDPGHQAWSPRAWVPLVTDFFAAGLSRCLIGTRALLGEGWNAPCANVLIDLGGATTSVSVHQVRGRTLRLDPEDPGKVADNWDVVVVAGGHVRGTADYERFVRKHQDYFALSGTGEIESGVSHVDSALGPFGPPPDDACAALTERLLLRPANREVARAGWRIGETYRDIAVDTVRIRMGRSPGLPGRRLFRDGAESDPDGIQGPATTIAALGGVGLVGGLMVGQPLLGGLVGALAGGSSVAVGRARELVGSLGPSDTLEDLAHAIAEALAQSGLINSDLRGTVVRVMPQPDGYYRCFLEGAGAIDAQRFAEALAELIEPIWDPRWIVSRRLRYVPTSPAGTIRLLAGQLRGVVPAGELVWHAVPTVLTRRQASIQAFERAWRLWVSADGRVLQATDPQAQGVLAARTGDDPFELETQRRVLWT